MSWKPEIKTINQATWTANGLRFATKEEAIRWGEDLFQRWMLVDEWRATESDEPVNYRLDFETGQVWDTRKENDYGEDPRTD